jgi:hypothetical protein
MSLTLFKYADHTPNLNTLFLTNAQAITGFKSVMWIERYRDAGEFTITAPVSSGLRTKLPLGSLISHTETQELMIVESHEINDTINGDVNVVITGRSFETMMENRVLSYNGVSGAGGFPIPPNQAIPTYYFVESNTPANHLVEVIEWHCYDGGIFSTQNITNLRTVSTVPGGVGVATTREMEITDLYSSVLELLAIDDLGIRSVRPGPLSGLPLATDLGFIIHKGEDKSASVAFDHASGDIRNGQYLWTNKKKKTSVLIQGTTYRAIKSDGSSSAGYDFRAGYIDAKEIDTGVFTDDLNALLARGESYLATHKEKNIVRVEVTPTTNRLRYRQDYDVGDLVAVTGNYDTAGVMRVVEHVEIVDENGQSSYPTLEAI